MANIVYPHAHSRSTLVNLLIVNGLPVDEASKLLRVPYNVLANQIKTKLTAEEQLKVKYKRIRYTWKEKIAFLREVKATSPSQVAKKYGLTTNQLWNWKKQYRKLVEEHRRLELEKSAKKSVRK